MKVIEGFNEFSRKMSADEKRFLPNLSGVALGQPSKSAMQYTFTGVMISAPVPFPVLTSLTA